MPESTQAKIEETGEVIDVVSYNTTIGASTKKNMLARAQAKMEEMGEATDVVCYSTTLGA